MKKKAAVIGVLLAIAVAVGAPLKFNIISTTSGSHGSSAQVSTHGPNGN